MVMTALMRSVVAAVFMSAVHARILSTAPS